MDGDIRPAEPLCAGPAVDSTPLTECHTDTVALSASYHVSRWELTQVYLKHTPPILQKL